MCLRARAFATVTHLAVVLLAAPGLAWASDAGPPPAASPGEAPDGGAPTAESPRGAPGAAAPSVGYPRGGSDPGSPLQAWPGPDSPAAPPDAARPQVGVVDAPDATDVLLIVPRLTLLPLRAAAILISPPIEAVSDYVEAHRIRQRVDRALHNRAHTAGVRPTLSFVTELGGAIGVEVFHRDVIENGETLSLTADFGGSVRQRYRIAFGGARMGGAPLWLDSKLTYEEDPTELFAGLGDPSVTDRPTGEARLDPRAASVQTRYRDAGLRVVAGGGPNLDRPDARVRPGLHVAYERRAVGVAERSGDLSIDEVYDVDALPGFEPNVRTLELLVSIGTRHELDSRGDTLAFEGFAGRGLPIDDFHYWTWGLESTLRIVVFRETRTVTLTGGVTAVTGDEADVPFFAMPSLGGERRLRGHLTDVYRDGAAGLGSAEYNWYINSRMDGLLFVDVGRVAPTAAELLDGPADRWHVSGGGGIGLGLPGWPWFRAVVAYGDALRFYLATDIAGLVRPGTAHP